MTTRTHVTIQATIGVSDNEARTVLGPLIDGRPFGPVEIWRSNGTGQPVTLFVSLDGDVEEQVTQKLSSTTDLPFTVDVVEQLDF